MRPAQLLAIVAVLGTLLGLAAIYIASSDRGSTTIPGVSFLLFGMAFVCGVGLVVLWGVADLLNQHRELNERKARDLSEPRS